MSTLGRQQLSPGEKALKYEFSLEILSFWCDVPFPCSIKFMWKRNTKSIETKSSHEIKPKSPQLTLNQKLSSISTIIYNIDKRQFQPKQSELIVNMFFNNSPKKLANAKIDMRAILDPHNYRAPKTETFALELKANINANSNCRLSYRLSSVFKQELVPSERSIGAGLNTSGMSIQQDKYFQKKYDVPSKDCHSVTSNYPSRYPSANKREEGSLRKIDYGYLTGLKSNISSHQQDLDSRSGIRSGDNKTEVGDGNYLARQLLDEQNKRSRAEAELAKNAVQIGQLKKKINQFAIDNLKLKEQVKITLQKDTNASKEEINSLQFKVYELNNQLRQTKNQLQLRKRDYERSQSETASLRAQNGSLELQLSGQQKKMEELQRNASNSRLVDSLQSQNRDLKYQIENLRRFIQDIKRQHTQEQARASTEIHELTSRIVMLQTQREKLQAKQKQFSQTGRDLAQTGKELQEYKLRLGQYQSQKSFLQRQIIRLKQESNDRRQLDILRQQMEQQISILSAQNSRLTEQLHQQQQQFSQTSDISSNAEIDRLMRESLQLQVELKFAKDEASRLRAAEQALQGQKWRADKEYNQRLQLQRQNDRITKELASKNRALMIEVEKTKHMAEQIAEGMATLAQYKEEIDRSRSIIFHSQEHMNQLVASQRALEEQLGRANDDRSKLVAERERLLGAGEEARILHAKVNELQARNSQKLQSLEGLNRNLLLANSQIKQLQNRLQSLQGELASCDRNAAQWQGRVRELQRQRGSVEIEMNKLVQQKKQAEKRSEMMMEEMHVMKKRYQEQKGRSLSFTRTSEDFNKVRTLECEVEKKEKAISRLNKQKLQLQQQNVKINVQVMKLLSDLQKCKSALNSQSSIKTISSYK